MQHLVYHYSYAVTSYSVGTLVVHQNCGQLPVDMNAFKEYRQCHFKLFDAMTHCCMFQTNKEIKVVFSCVMALESFHLPWITYCNVIPAFFYSLLSMYIPACFVHCAPYVVQWDPYNVDMLQNKKHVGVSSFQEEAYISI